ncbi:MAG: hypothetical protein GTN36_00645 [Candidatus Aenigmarchaeota archaeon]|nr:hypothetical protein [Candidatus Aenigmarchaeota archaeon]
MKTEFEIEFGMTIEEWRKRSIVKIALMEVKNCAEKYYKVNWMDNYEGKRQRLAYWKKKIIQAGINYRNIINDS